MDCLSDLFDLNNCAFMIAVSNRASPPDEIAPAVVAIYLTMFFSPLKRFLKKLKRQSKTKQKNNKTILCCIDPYIL